MLLYEERSHCVALCVFFSAAIEEVNGTMKQLPVLFPVAIVLLRMNSCTRTGTVSQWAVLKIVHTKGGSTGLGPPSQLVTAATSGKEYITSSLILSHTPCHTRW